jgi:hypothetical protein
VAGLGIQLLGGVLSGLLLMLALSEKGVSRR